MKQTSEAKAETVAAELRDLIREAHEAIKDMTGLLREFRQIIATGEQRGRDACAESADAELRKWYEHVQAEMNRNAASLNKAVEAARDAVVQQLTVSYLEPTADGKLKLCWKAGKFDEQAEVVERK